MGIKILPENEIKQAASDFHHPALLFANPKNLYQRRIKRLKQLAAQENPLADYLSFVAQVTQAQLEVLSKHPIAKEPRLENITLEQNTLYANQWQRDPIWIKLLYALLDEISPQDNEMIAATIDWLRKASELELNELADQLLQANEHKLPQDKTDKAVFIWAALSLYWVQLVQQIPHQSKMESGANLQLCPVCHSAPVASVIHLGSNQGLRYLHCALCESEWNMVRSKCTHCEQTGKLDYWSLDSEFAAVKTESCGDCHSYLKVLYQEKNPDVEAVADDLASIYLDLEMEEKGFARSGQNPFLFSAEE